MLANRAFSASVLLFLQPDLRDQAHPDIHALELEMRAQMNAGGIIARVLLVLLHRDLGATLVSTDVQVDNRTIPLSGQAAAPRIARMPTKRGKR